MANITLLRAIPDSRSLSRPSADNHYTKVGVEALGSLGDSGGRVLMQDLDSWLGGALEDPATFQQEESALEVQDGLYKRFQLKNGGNPIWCEFFSPQISMVHEQLLHAIKHGDVPAIRSFVRRRDFSWNFVYPPARKAQGFGGTTIRQVEGWCRSPLGLLVNPSAGNLEGYLRGVPDEQRYGLIREVLQQGGADPNFPGSFWASPGFLAAYAGDVEALRLLHKAGCDLEQKVEFALQPKPLFSLLHAAAFNGHLPVLEYLKQHVPATFLGELDGDLNNPLHWAVKSSRHMETALFLLREGIDGFALNRERRSPLSMAIEYMSEFARALLEGKARFDHRYWGNDLYWFSFQGVVLPLDEQEGGPLRVRDGAGGETTVEELIVTNERKHLMDTPLIMHLLDLKWAYFGRRRYRRRVVVYAAFMVVTMMALVLKPGTPWFDASALAFVVLWFIEALAAFALLRKRRTFWICLDVVNLLVAAAAVLVKLAAATSDGAKVVLLNVAPLVGVLQLMLTLRVLRMLALFDVIGKLILSLLGMLGDVSRFASIIAIIVLGFANAFYALVWYAESIRGEPGSDGGGGDGEDAFDFKYGSLVNQLCLSLMDTGNLGPLTDSLSGPTLVGGLILFWIFCIANVVALLNLIIAVFTTTYERVNENSGVEMLFAKLRTLQGYESSTESPDVQRYFGKIVQHDGQKSVRELVLPG